MTLSAAWYAFVAKIFHNKIETNYFSFIDMFNVVMHFYRVVRGVSRPQMQHNLSVLKPVLTLALIFITGSGSIGVVVVFSIRFWADIFLGQRE